MTEYLAEDGLNILTYLGILNLTEEERKVFREKWDRVYQMHQGNPIMTTWILYSETLPFTCGDRDRGSFVAAQIRGGEFGERLEESDLDGKLKKGVSLEEIFAASPERFSRLN